MSEIPPHIAGDITFIRDCLSTAIREINTAEDLTDMYNMEDLVDLLHEGITVSDQLLGDVFGDAL